MTRRAIKDWLDERVPDWRWVSSECLDRHMRELWKRGGFKSLKMATFDDSQNGRAVKVGDTYYAWIEV